IAHGGIALLDNLRRRGVKMDNTCLVCGNAKPYVFSMQSGQGAEILNFFVGWRLWKMRNNIIFNNKRDHIINMINGALRD
ncbi:unnamed protein product, partial [Brassica rapa]